MTMSPESGRRSPVTSFISEDLPHPEGPTTAANSAPPDGQRGAFKREHPARGAAVGQRDVGNVDGAGHTAATAPLAMGGKESPPGDRGISSWLAARAVTAFARTREEDICR